MPISPLLDAPPKSSGKLTFLSSIKGKGNVSPTSAVAAEIVFPAASPAPPTEKRSVKSKTPALKEPLKAPEIQQVPLS